jgi:hypothetical protein
MGGVDVYSHVFLTSTLVGGEWLASWPGYFIPREKAPGTQCIGGWVDSKTSLDHMEMRTFLSLSGLELQHLSCPVCSQLLYWLCYPGSHQTMSNRMLIGTNNTQYTIINLVISFGNQDILSVPSLPFSQNPIKGPYTMLPEFNPHVHTISKMQFNIILSSMTRFPISELPSHHYITLCVCVYTLRI